MACLVFGDSLGLHPSTALKEVFVADGKVGISGALMLALIRNAGHKIEWEEITTENIEQTVLGDGFVGWKCIGQRDRGRARSPTRTRGRTRWRTPSGRASIRTRRPGGVDENAEADVPLARARAGGALPVLGRVRRPGDLHCPTRRRRPPTERAGEPQRRPGGDWQERSEGDIDYGERPAGSPPGWSRCSRRRTRSSRACGCRRRSERGAQGQDAGAARGARGGRGLDRGARRRRAAEARGGRASRTRVRGGRHEGQPSTTIPASTWATSQTRPATRRGSSRLD
jgi:hypothetical protein